MGRLLAFPKTIIRFLSLMYILTKPIGLISPDPDNPKLGQLVIVGSLKIYLVRIYKKLSYLRSTRCTRLSVVHFEVNQQVQGSVNVKVFHHIIKS